MHNQLSSLINRSDKEVFSSLRDFAPVITILPDANIRKLLLESPFNIIPGNISGSYTALGISDDSMSIGRGLCVSAVATIFLMTG